MNFFKKPQKIDGGSFGTPSYLNKVKEEDEARKIIFEEFREKMQPKHPKYTKFGDWVVIKPYATCDYFRDLWYTNPRFEYICMNKQTADIKHFPEHEVELMIEINSL